MQRLKGVMVNRGASTKKVYSDPVVIRLKLNIIIYYIGLAEVDVAIRIVVSLFKAKELDMLKRSNEIF